MTGKNGKSERWDYARCTCADFEIFGATGTGTTLASALRRLGGRIGRRFLPRSDWLPFAGGRRAGDGFAWEGDWGPVGPADYPLHRGRAGSAEVVAFPAARPAARVRRDGGNHAGT